MSYYVHHKAWTKVSIVDFGIFVCSIWADPKLISFILKCEKKPEWSCVMLSWLKILSCWPFSNSLIIIFLRFYIQAILHIYLFLCTWICPLKMLAVFSDLFSVTGKSDGCFSSPAVLNCWDKTVFAATILTENKKLILYFVAFHCRNFLVLYVENSEWNVTDSVEMSWT